MAITPPPYSNVTGIYRQDDKHSNVTLAQYNGNARPGELVVSTADYSLWIGNAQGSLNPITGGSGNGTVSAPISAVQFNLDGTNFGGSSNFTWDNGNSVLSLTGAMSIAGNIIPITSNTYNLGSPTRQWKSLYVSSNTIFIDGIPLSINSNSQLLVNNSPVVTTSANGATAQTGTIHVTGNVESSNIVVSNAITANGNIYGDYFHGNGAFLTGITVDYGNSNVAAYLPTYTGILRGASVTATGNVTGNYFIGNGALLTGITTNYSNANVAAYLPTYTGIVRASSMTATGNIAGNYFVGNGALLTGITNYSNTNVAAYLPTYTGNVSANYFIGNGALLTGITTNYSNANVANYLPTYTGILRGASVTATGNVTGNYFVGNGALLTGITINYSNANVASFLPTYSGVVSASSMTATGNIAGNYFVGNGALLTGITTNYSNANVANYLPTYTGNVSANYFIGNGALLTGITTNYSNANVANYLPTYTGELAALQGDVTTIGNVSANYFFGDGSQLTNLPQTYGNSNVASYLSTYTGNISANTINATGTINGTDAVIANSVTANLFIGTFQGNISGNLVVPGANTQVIYNNNGNAGADIGFTYDAGTKNVNIANTLITTDVVANGNVTANYFIGDGSLLTNLPADNYSNANVANYLPTYSGNLESLTGNVTTTANVSAAYFIGNGSQLTGLPAGYSNAEVAAYLPTYTGELAALEGDVTTIGNVSANYLFGDGSFITNLPLGNYSNANVANYLPTYSGNLESLTGDVVTTGNISANYVIGDGSLLTNLPVTYGNANVADYLPTYTGNVSANYFIGNGALLTGLPAGYSNADVAAYLPTYTGNVGALDINATGNVTANYFIGDGSQLTGLPAGYSNANVAAYLPTYTGNVSANYFIGDGSQLTGMYGNANVAEYLPTYTGNLTANTINATATISATDAFIANAVTANLFIGTFQGNISGNLVVPGANTQVLFNNDGNAGADIGFTYDATTKTANIANTLNITDVVANGNITAAQFVGNGSQLTGITSNQVSGLGNVSTINLNGNVSTVLAGDGTWIEQTGGANVLGNAIPLGTPTDGNLVSNVSAYDGWTPATYVTDGLDDLNQVALNIAKGTFVGQTDFTANVSSGPSPLTVAFTGSYVGNANAYLWDFGDGSNSTSGANVTHTYSNVSGGQYTVTFTAYNTNGTYAGNAVAGAKGSVDSVTKTDFITLYTPLPIPSFTTSPTSLDTGNSVTITNTSLYATSYSINYGDGNTVTPSNVWTTNAHTYVPAANTDSLYNIVLTGTNQTAGATPPYNVNSSPTSVKVYSQHTPVMTANILTVINNSVTSGGVVSFRNDTTGTPGNTASFGAQQYYKFQWGDGTANSNVNIQSGLAGNPGAANVTHTFALTAGQQANGNIATYTANLLLFTGYSASPFVSSNVVINVEPEIRANFVGTANTVSDRTGDTAQTGYIYTDYNGNNRALFNFQNSTSPTPPFTANAFSWNWGDTTFSNVTASANLSHTYTATGSKTVALTANGSPGTISQSNTRTNTSYITINSNPVAPGELSTKTLILSTASEGTSPLLAAGAVDNTGGNIVANGTSVTRYVSAANVVSSVVTTANTATSGTLTAYVSSTSTGNTTFTTSGNAVGTYTGLVVTVDADAHVAISASTYPSYFYKVFSAYITRPLANLSVGFNNYQLRHTVSGNTNAVGFVKDNLSSVATLSNANVTMTETTAGTYRYISGIPYYNTGSPTLSINTLAVANLVGQTYVNTTTPLTVSTGTAYEGTTGSVITAQTKTYAQLDGTPSMLTAGIPNANIGISSSYTFGNQSVSINGGARAVATLQTNIVNVNGTSATIQLPTKVQIYSLAITGINEESIPVSALLGTVYTDNGVRITGLGSANDTPTFNGATNYYTGNVWSGPVTVAGTQEAIVRWGVLQQFASTNFSTGYLPAGPDLVTGRSGTQYFTFAFRRAAVSNFDIILSGKVSGVWMAAPGSQIDSTSTLNGWIDCTTQYSGAGIPGANVGAGGNGSNGCALTGADRIPTGTTVTNQRYTQTLGEENTSNSTGNNVLIRIALASGDSLTDVQIGVAT